MPKVDIKRLDSVTNNDTTATKQINDNFQALQQAVENTISRDGTVPNYMDANFDLNSYRIINAGDPVGDQDVVTLKYFEERAGGAIEAAAEAKASASQAASSAQSALVASNNAIGQLSQAEGLLTATEQFVDSAKADINTAVSDAESTISTIVSDAEGSITNIAVTEANKAIANAAQEATDTATANLNSYVDGTVKPSLQTYVDQAQEKANSAATSMEQAALSATAASNYASNASSYADNASESAGLAANSAAEANQSEEKAAEYLQQISNKITVVEGSIGDIGFAPLGIDEAENKRRYLNGQVISQAQFVSFTNKIKSAIQLYPNLATSETNWQAEKTNSKLGQCGKFVVDDTAGTIRLPCVVNAQGLVDLALIGGIKSESLPNIKGNTTLRSNNRSATGAFYVDAAAGSDYAGTGSNGEKLFGYAFDASHSSSTYQNNAPVQQEAVQYPYFIQVATGVEESVDVTREIELNNPFSLLDYKWSEYALSNASWLLSNGAFHSGATYPAVYELLLKIKNGTETKDGVSVKLSTESYTDTDFVLNTADTTFRLPLRTKDDYVVESYQNGYNLYRIYKSGWIEQGGYHAFSSDTWEAVTLLKPMKNNRYMALLTGTGTVETLKGWKVGAEDKNTSTTLYAICANNYSVRWYVSGQGAEEPQSKTYFYVGETVQDANVIAASQVLTKVANGIDRTVATDRETVVGWGIPDYSAGINIAQTLKTSPYSYTAPTAGVIRFRLSDNASWLINSTPKQHKDNSLVYIDGEQGVYMTSYLMVGKGQTIYETGSHNGKVAMFYPMKGAN